MNGYVKPRLPHLEIKVIDYSNIASHIKEQYLDHDTRSVYETCQYSRFILSNGKNDKGALHVVQKE